jgi:hypothetical protein
MNVSNFSPEDTNQWKNEARDNGRTRTFPKKRKQNVETSHAMTANKPLNVRDVRISNASADGERQS